MAEPRYAGRLDAAQLAALAAVVEFGSFEAAAAQLHITPSAVSQRIKALEQHVGQVLIVREKPCTATAAGVPLLRLAAQTALLESEALTEMGRDGGERTRVALAVNADSMATWFTAAFARLPQVLFDIRIEDQDLSARFLRQGEVMGAVTTDRHPVPGCRVFPLGAMRYVAVASADYVKRYLAEGFRLASVGTAPSLAWNRDDALQDRLVRKVFRRDVARPIHYIPTAEGFREAVKAGLGWGMFPEQSVDRSLIAVTDQQLDVPLFWQCWKLDSPLINSITDAIRTASVSLLRHQK